MNRIVLTTMLVVLLGLFTNAQVILTAPNGTYSENFDGMGTTGTTYPQGWTAIRTGGSGTVGQTLTLAVTNGSATGGGVYNTGASSSPDRALGTLASGTTVPALGASFTNNTGTAITQLSIAAFAEQWRSSSNSSVNEVVAFEYSTDATSLNSGTWTAVPALDLKEILTASTSAGPVDGNNIANRNSITANIIGLNITNGSTFWIRWRDADDAGSDGLYAVDDFQLTYNGGTTSNTASIARVNDASEPSTAGRFTITFNPATTTTSTINYAFEGTATFGTDYTASFSAGTPATAAASGTLEIPAGTASITVLVTPIDDNLVEGWDTVRLTLSSPTNFYSFNPAASFIGLGDDDTAPTIAISDTSNAAEPGTDGYFLLRLSAPAPAGGVTVTYTLAGTATAGTDYTDPNNGTRLVPAGATTDTIFIRVVNDNVIEPREYVQMTLNTISAPYVNNGSPGSLSIIDEDVPPTISLVLGTNGREPGTAPADRAYFSIQSSVPAPTGGINFTYSIAGTATAGTDYTDPQTGTGFIPAGATTTRDTLFILPVDDLIAEPTETVIVTLASASAGFNISGGAITITITDNDVPALTPIALTGSLYQQDFNTLDTTGSSFNLPQGWTFIETGSFANNTYTANNGTSSTGNTYSLGNNGSPDRAFGTLQSGSLVATVGAQFQNKTGATITSLVIQYTGEQWRQGSRNRFDSLQFSYSTTATSLTGSGFTRFDALSFATADTTGAATGANNGNAAGFRRMVMDTIKGLNIAPDGLFFIRWTDFNAAGSDDALGIDDFSIAAIVFRDTVAPVVIRLNPVNGNTAFPSNNPLEIVFSETVVKGSGNISITNVTDNSVQSIDVTSAAVVVNGADVRINTLLTGGKQYSISIPAGTFKDTAGNNFAGFTNGWTFTVVTPDTVRPTVVSLTPANGSTGVSVNPTFSIKFSERIVAGNGVILIRSVSNNSDAAVIPLTAVRVADSTATFSVTGLQPLTTYYVYFPDTTFKDAANNFVTGFENNTGWRFTTGGITAYSFNFNDCSVGGVPGSGFTRISLQGDSLWNCTTFGFTSTGVQINGFSAGGIGAVANDDWLISPSLNLTGFNVPVLSFRMRTRFAGPQLEVLISTNYGGVGRPDTLGATWTALRAQLAAPNSDVWVLVDSINLAAYKTANTFVAFRYQSSPSAGASRITIDDVTVTNASGAPLARINITPRLLNFDYAAPGSASVAKVVNVVVFNATTPLTVKAPAPFQVSKNNSTFGDSVTFTVGDLATAQTLYVRFAPATANMVYNSTLQWSSPAAAQVLLAGNTYTRSTTLDVVNWNIEWFGSTGNGPTNESLQQANAKRIMDSLDADVYGVAEIVDTARLGALTRSLNGSYSYVVSDYASNASTPASGNWANGQKLAFVYRNGIITNVRARGMLRNSSTAFTNWASGRVPFLMTADVVNGTASARYNFVMVHGKANTGNTAAQIESYNERIAGARELKDTLDAFFTDERLIIMGDYNDDLDSTIAPVSPPRISSYSLLVADSTDAISYRSITLPLSRAGLQSTTANPDVVDHQIISNEVVPDYLAGTARLVTEVETFVTNFSGTTSDHYPVMSRYLLPAVTTSIPTISAAQMGLVILPNPVRSSSLQFTYKAVSGSTVYRIADVNGRVLAQSVMQRVAAGVRTERWNLPQMSPGTYVLQIINGDRKSSQLFLKQ